MENLVLEMTNLLLNKKLVYEKAESDRDYSGGGWYSDVKLSIILYADKSFEAKKQTFSSVSGGGLSLPSESNEVKYGYWCIDYKYPNLLLVLRYENGLEELLETESLGIGLQRIGNQTWNRYRLE
jgi:hypothetical protein